MKKLLLGLMFAVGFIISISLIWRLLSQRISLPCPSWLHWLVELDNPFAQVSHAKTIVEHLSLTPGMKVLDVGCGPGRVTIPIAEKIDPQGQVTAMDIQPGMLQLVQSKAQAKNIHNIRLLEAGVGNGTLEHNYYDRALLVTVLGEIPDQRAALQELFDTLKPGGILSVTEIIFDPHFQSRTTVSALAKAVGFQEKNCFGRWFAFTMQFEKP